LRALYALSLKNNHAGFVQCPDFHGDIFARAQKYQEEQGEMLGLFDNGKIIGCGGLKRKDAIRVELCNLHLHPDYQRRGLGRRLALALLEDAEALGYGVVELHVTVTQEPAIALYKSLGFTQTRRQVYETEGQSFDTIFMEKAV
jgi:ribosomal protein S18 acetylase RimI-like enzyme